ncbi:hypothetical protein Tco_0906085 [Tanacetum coccineum]
MVGDRWLWRWRGVKRAGMVVVGEVGGVRRSCSAARLPRRFFLEDGKMMVKVWSEGLVVGSGGGRRLEVGGQSWAWDPADGDGE